MKWFVLLSVVVLGGCATVTQPMDVSKYFRRDIQIEHDGKVYEGVAVLPSRSLFDLVLKPKGDMDLMIIRSCHRELVVEKASSGGLFKKNEYRYLYQPVSGIEDSAVCPLRVDALESGNSAYSGAFVDFERPEFTLPFTVQCNGTTTRASGTAACQARQQTTQVVRFDAPIRFAPPEPTSCPVPVRRGAQYEISAQAGECSYFFDSEDGKVGHLTLLGYENVVLRKAP